MNHLFLSSPFDTSDYAKASSDTPAVAKAMAGTQGERFFAIFIFVQNLSDL
jgi:hypothetical protein